MSIQSMPWRPDYVLAVLDVKELVKGRRLQETYKFQEVKVWPKMTPD